MNDAEALSVAVEYARRKRVGLLIVAYNAEKTIEGVLRQIPAELAGCLAEIFVFDDFSCDDTSHAAADAAARLGMQNFRVFRTPANQGYGGNQILGYTYAIRQGFDVVVMLHGDGQYPPEYLPNLIAPFSDPATACTLGSRMVRRRDALRGGMPVYKWLGNQVLTWFENRMLHAGLTEFHTGYRAFRLETLRQIPFEHNSHDFHFDTEILIQLISWGQKIVEVAVPTHYGDEVCHVNGFHYAWQCVKAVIKYRLFRMGLFYNRFLDAQHDGPRYDLKEAANSLHQHVLRQDFRGERVLDLGAGTGRLAARMAAQAERVVAVDLQRPPQEAAGLATAAVDLNGDFDRQIAGPPFDTIVALDVLEHLNSPEEAAVRAARLLRPGGRLLASTANVGFFIVRTMLLFGQFNYGRRGILDMTHTRLFTVRSFVRLLEDCGFKVESIRGVGPPIRDGISKRFPYSWIDTILAWLARVWPRMFAFNFLVRARRQPSLEEVYAGTVSKPREPEP
jgi:2-polyprenyl-3-methyl-5-hydroxy-6-metoxy-1,4-benzoquinol methylase